MRVLVIGGTGNVGIGVVAALVERNHDVVVFTRDQHPNMPPSEVRIIRGDRRNPKDFARKVRRESFDAVIDLMCFSAGDAASALKIFGDKVDHFIHCSTVMTYGPPFDGIYLDENAPLYGHSQYGLGKIAADTLLLEAYRKSGFPVTIFKPSFTYGTQILRQVGGDSRWISRLLNGKPILSAGDGLNHFQFLSTWDAGVGFAGVLGKKQALGEIYNIVHPVPRTWDDWHNAVAKSLGVEAKIVHVPQQILIAISPERFSGLMENFGHVQVFDATKLMSTVPEFQPTEDMVESIADTIALMDPDQLVPRYQDDELEDRIIAAVQNLPTSIARSC